jgi:hypothetical protein
MRTGRHPAGAGTLVPVTVDASPAEETASPGNGAEGTDRSADPVAPGERRRLPRALIVVAVLLMLSMWGYVIYLAFGPGRQPPLDRLDDPAFAQAGEARCAEAEAAVDALPGAGGAPDAADRADVIDRANAEYAAMLDDLEAELPLAPAGVQREHAAAWLADWRLYLGDRAEFADALRADPDARLLVSEKPGETRQVTGWIDEFALANKMESCATPTDV